MAAPPRSTTAGLPCISRDRIWDPLRLFSLSAAKLGSPDAMSPRPLQARVCGDGHGGSSASRHPRPRALQAAASPPPPRVLAGMLPPPPVELPAGFTPCVVPPPPSKLAAPATTSLPMPATAAPCPSAASAAVLAAAVLASRKADPSIGGRLSGARRLPRSGTTVAPAQLPAIPAAMAKATVDQLQHPPALVCPATDLVAHGLPSQCPPTPGPEKLAPAMTTQQRSLGLSCQSCVVPALNLELLSPSRRSLPCAQAGGVGAGASTGTRRLLFPCAARPHRRLPGILWVAGTLSHDAARSVQQTSVVQLPSCGRLPRRGCGTAAFYVSLEVIVPVSAETQFGVRVVSASATLLVYAVRNPVPTRLRCLGELLHHRLPGRRCSSGRRAFAARPCRGGRVAPHRAL